jgi:hypothetical protein
MPVALLSQALPPHILPPLVGTRVVNLAQRSRISEADTESHRPRALLFWLVIPALGLSPRPTESGRSYPTSKIRSTAVMMPVRNRRSWSRVSSDEMSRWLVRSVDCFSAHPSHPKSSKGSWIALLTQSSRPGCDWVCRLLRCGCRGGPAV